MEAVSAAVVLVLQLLLSSHPAAILEDLSKPGGITQKTSSNLPTVIQAHPGDQHPVQSTIPPCVAADPQLTPVCSSSGKIAPRSFSGDDPACRELPWGLSLRGETGIFPESGRKQMEKRKPGFLSFYCFSANQPLQGLTCSRVQRRVQREHHKVSQGFPHVFSSPVKQLGPTKIILSPTDLKSKPASFTGPLQKTLWLCNSFTRHLFSPPTEWIKCS